MPHADHPRLAIVITCYNYAKFVADAINSVLEQEQDVEIVVVDDCSTDNSRKIISGFGDKVTAVFQPVNSGHGAGFNTGYAATQSNSELVMFLDADDFLVPGAVDAIIGNYDPGCVMYLYRMRYADEAGALSGVHPPFEVAIGEGDLSTKIRTTGRYNGQITSGLVFSRDALEKVLPMDGEAYRQGGDGYLCSVVPLYGRSKSCDDTISAYRLHGLQHSKFKADYAKRARWCIGHDFERYCSIREHSRKLNLEVADSLEKRDAGHLYQRIVSLLFEPDLHPVKTDRLNALVSQLRALPDADSLFWKLFTLVPHVLKTKLMSWRVDPKARPTPVAYLGRFFRRRFGVIFR